MHHKRKGPKSTRAGCLMCKPHKRQGAKLKERLRRAHLARLRAGRAAILEHQLERGDDNRREETARPDETA